MKHSDEWKSGSVRVRFMMFCSYVWKWLRFTMKRKTIASCKPVVVRDALEHSEARLFQRLSKILHHFNNVEEGDDVQEEGDGIFRIIFRFCRRLSRCFKPDPSDKKSTPRPPNMHTELEPPPQFMSSFSPKYRFISDTFPDESIRILLTLIIFDRDDDMGDSRMATSYLQCLRQELLPMKMAMQSIFSIVSEIAQKEQQVQNRQMWMVRFLKQKLLGLEGSCLSRFSTYSDREMGEFFADKGFEEFSKTEMMLIPVQQLVSAATQWQSGVAFKPLRQSRRAMSDSPSGEGAPKPRLTSSSIRYRISSATALGVFRQPQPTSLRPRPQLLRAKTISLSDSSEISAFKKSIPIESDAMKARHVDIDQKNQELEALLKLQQDEIAALKAQAEESWKAFTAEVALLKLRAEEASKAKDQEISALQGTVARLMKKCISLAQVARAPTSASDPVYNFSGQTAFQQAQNRNRVQFDELQDIQAAEGRSSSDSESAADV
jgi:hypothetical protein